MVWSTIHPPSNLRDKERSLLTDREKGNLFLAKDCF